MKTKTKNTLCGFVAVLVLLIIAVVWMQALRVRQSGSLSTKREDLENIFLNSFPQEEYEAISFAEHGRWIVYLGRTKYGEGKYAIFQKSLLFDSWTRTDRQTMKEFHHPMMRSAPSMGRVYLSLNGRRITRAVVTKADEIEEIDVDPTKPMVVITDYKIDEIVFYTESNKEVSEKDFLDSPF